jgi:hypothetical protein
LPLVPRLTSPYSAVRTEWVGTAAMGRPAKLELSFVRIGM